MTIKRKNISDISQENLNEIYNIYTYSFPSDERRDWNIIINPESDKYFAEAILSENNDILGLIFYWQWNDIIYIEHIAISQNFRSKGIASTVLNDIIQVGIDKKIVLEIEVPSQSNEAQKRYEFYHRLGFEVIDKKYIQPPYSKDKEAVNMYLLSRPIISEKEVLIKELYRLVYNVNL